MDRLTECSGVVSGSCVSSIDSAEDNLVCCRSERGNDANAMFDELEGKELPARKCVDSDAVENVQVYNNLDVGKHLELDAKIHIQGRRKTSANKITGIQFSQEISQGVMITSKDSKVHVFDGIDIIHKYRGRGFYNIKLILLV
ncbi:WD repeat-containing protein 44-like [Fagus crenata]